MKKTNSIYLILLMLILILATTTCKDSSDNSNPAPQTEDPLIHEGDIVNSDFYVNDVLKEQMIDTVVNLGSTAQPALFYVNQKHTIDGAPVAIGNHASNVFRSLTRDEHYIFIVLWGRLLGMTIDLNDQSPVAVARRQLAFYELQAFLMKNNIDLPLLISLANSLPELQCAKKWVDAADELNSSGVNLDESNTPDGIFRALENSGFKVSELSNAVQAAGMTEKDFLFMAQHNKINLASTLQHLDSPRQIGFVIVALVFTGVKWFSTLTVHLIDAGKPNPNLNDEYVSYLNDADSNVMNYIGRKDTVSPTYKVAYCTLATAEFYVETYYDAYHQTLAGTYVNRSGMIVKSVHCSWGMHVDGTTAYEIGQYSGTEENPIAYSNATVTIHYGDCCCNKRTGTLKFKVSGDQGYQQVSWNSGK